MDFCAFLYFCTHHYRNRTYIYNVLKKIHYFGYFLYFLNSPNFLQMHENLYKSLRDNYLRKQNSSTVFFSIYNSLFNDHKTKIHISISRN